MKRAKDFEEQEDRDKMRRPIEGQLYKYTNVMKGWQYRWFILNPKSGILAYFMPDDLKRQQPRGAVKLSGAVISPSDEDSQTFYVNFASGDVFKLRAVDAKERQQWVNQLRSITQRHTQPLCQQKFKPGSDLVDGGLVTSSPEIFNVSQEIMMYPTSSCASDAVNEVKSVLQQASLNNDALIMAIETLPLSGPGELLSSDKDLLMIKALSQASFNCLQQCMSIIHQGNIRVAEKSLKMRSASNSSASTGHRSSTGSVSSNVVSTSQTVTSSIPPYVPDDEEVSDEEQDLKLENTGGSEDNKNTILFVLSQLKLGMDLTKVILPTFILEPKSLLEVYSDFMGHPEFFVSISDGPTPQQRMVSVLKWFLTSFHVGWPNAVATKPYNPLRGETFRCSWLVPVRRRSNASNSKADDVSGLKVRYISEHVSHHPVTSAIYVECPEKQMYLNAHITTRSKFMGTSIGVNLVGDLILCSLFHGEEYIITLPSLFARSILSVPWVEFGGKVTITSNSGYISTVIFHTKPFYGGKLHRVTAEVKSPNGDVLCKVGGEWNGSLEFSFNDGTAFKINTVELTKAKKKVQKLENQSLTDSRRVWRNISQELQHGDIDKASRLKEELEEMQRLEEKRIKSGQAHFQTQHFQKDSDGKWIYRKLLKNADTPT
ncbi:OSBPL10 (predicted) [Pycnogonum litorale]